MPLNGSCLKEQNSCFLDTETGVPYQNQWLFLAQVARVGQQFLEQLYRSLNTEIRKEVSTGENLAITRCKKKCLNKDSIQPILFSFIKNELNFLNQDFIVRKNVGRNTFGTERYFRLIEEADHYIFLPRGFIGSLIWFCREQGITFTFHDKRVTLPRIIFSFQAMFRPYQEESLEIVRKKKWV